MAFLLPTFCTLGRSAVPGDCIMPCSCQLCNKEGFRVLLAAYNTNTKIKKGIVEKGVAKKPATSKIKNTKQHNVITDTPPKTHRRHADIRSHGGTADKAI